MADPIIPEKTCTKCNALKSVTEFPRNTRDKSGYESWCKVCKKEANAKHYATVTRADKTCASCGLTKPVNECFARTRNPERADVCRACDKKQRFWAKVDKTPGHGPWGDCWIWTAYCNADGYGSFDHESAQIVSWEFANGPVPQGKYVLHSCDNRPCVNPAHLRIGTHLENMQDKMDRHRYYAPKLSADDIREMRRLRHVDGTIYRDIADLFSVSRKTAYDAINGRKHIV